MVRCYIVCEGQTEFNFVDKVLADYFFQREIYCRALMIPTSKNNKGGAITYDRAINFIINKAKEDKEAYITTMFDFYALDSKFLNNIEKDCDIYKYIENIECNFDKNIQKSICTSRFFSYIQLHEFEALIFSNIDEIIKEDAEWQINNKNIKKELDSIINKYKNPELINNGKETSPCHRLENIFKKPKYKKVLHGCNIAKRIGIDNIRKECKHFNEWCKRIGDLTAVK